MLAKKIWRLPDVLEQTGLSRSTIYEMIGRGEFPRQINLGPRAVGWIGDDVLDWIDFKIREARSHDSRS
jgi:prophage regulatory protein